MHQSEPTMKTVTIDEAQQQFDRLISEVAKGETQVTIEQDGRALVRMQAAVSPKQREIDELMKDAAFRDLAAIGLAFKDVPVEELEQEVARAIREGRERRRREREETPSSP